ncbi:HK97-gp10 family putative phage morphogenesis protein [Novosphingobium sp.]|uniref:HK97-gp10 family putative phage morphogenesis protein n=1 Tax=Novosphingobium sp. TaxID=1874826 RepID=UPI003D6CB4AA
MSRNSPVKGLAQLDAFLSAFPKRMQKQAIRQALTAAAAPVRDEARVRAPKKSGRMAKAIKTGSPRQNQDGTFSVSIRLVGDNAYLGTFFEFGVAAHLIARTGAGQGKVAIRKAAEGKGKISTKPMKVGDRYVSGIIHHPGFAAHPFLRPALDAKADEAVQAYATKIRAFIEGKTGYVAPVDEAD